MTDSVQDDPVVTASKKALHAFGFGRAVTEVRAALDHQGRGVQRFDLFQGLFQVVVSEDRRFPAASARDRR